MMMLEFAPWTPSEWQYIGLNIALFVFLFGAVGSLLVAIGFAWGRKGRMK